MSTCPRCKTTLTGLTCMVPVVAAYKMTVEGEETVYEDTMEVWHVLPYGVEPGKHEEFVCPAKNGRCGYVVARTEEDALAFLRGE